MNKENPSSKCKVCDKPIDRAEIKRTLGDIGDYCSAQCYTKAVTAEAELSHALDEKPELDGRFKDLMEKEIKDLEAGRITTRWDGIESKIDLGLSLVEDEAKTKALRRGLFASPHEGYGVIAEEVAELLEAIRSNDIERIRSEAVQVAAAGLVLVSTLALWDNVPEKIKEEIEQADINELGDLLTVCAIYVPRDIIEDWTPEERLAVEDWAGATHLAASDNDVEVPEMPECLARVLIKPKGERGGYPIKGE